MRVGGVTIPKLRLDALTDGVFAVAMTLLVIDLKLPEGFHPKDAAELLHRLGELGSQVLVYAMSFYVLGLRWIGMVQLAPRGEEVSEQYTRWALVHLLLITFVPFTTMVVGRYIAFPPAVWIYAANTIAFALIAIRMITLAETGHTPGTKLDHRIGLLVLIGASVLTVLISLVAPRWAMLGYLANLADEPVRWLRRRRGLAT
jgi:uncharacterized membrane protein